MALVPPHYTSRPTCHADLVDNIQVLLPVGYGKDASLHAMLPSAWEGMMRSRDVRGVAIEAQGQLVATNLRAIVSLDFLQELKASVDPFLGAAVVRRYLERGDEPLDAVGIRKRAQEAEGVGLVLMHSAYHSLDPGEMAPLALREYAFEAGLRADRGYPIRSALREVYSASTLRWFLAAGYRLQNDFGAAVPAAYCPFRLEAAAEDEGLEGYRTAMLFAHRPPRLGLRKTHRDLVEIALSGATDEEIADALCLSLSSVKQRWRTLYAHVENVAPSLVGGLRTPESRRGPERRRHLLAYVREHPEELQSWLR